MTDRPTSPDPTDGHPTENDESAVSGPTDGDPTERDESAVFGRDTGEEASDDEILVDAPGDRSFDPGHWPPGPAGPAAQYPVRRLYRSRSDQKIGGVSAGIAEFMGIDPTIVRLVTLGFAVTGIGIVVYLAAWLIVPLRPEGLVEPSRGTPIADERTLTIGFGVAALAVAIGIATGSWGVLAVALIAGGVWLLSERSAAPIRSDEAADTQPYGDPEPAYAPASDGPMPYPTPNRSVVDAPAPPYGEDTPPPDPRRPQRITWTVLAVLTLLGAIGALATIGSWWDVSETRLLGIGVAIITVGAVVGQIRGGGARGLIPLGILATVALFPVSAVDGLLDEGVGNATYRPTAIEELESRYRHGIGEMTVDLSELDLDGRSEDVDIDLGIGELVVIVSEDVGGRAELRATGGTVSHRTPTTRSFFAEDGLYVETGTLRLVGDNGSFDLDISVGFGTAELRLAQD